MTQSPATLRAAAAVARKASDIWLRRAAGVRWPESCVAEAVRLKQKALEYEAQADMLDNCPGHVKAPDGDPKVCMRCGIHIDDLRPPDEYDVPAQ